MNVQIWFFNWKRKKKFIFWKGFIFQFPARIIDIPVNNFMIVNKIVNSVDDFLFYLGGNFIKKRWKITFVHYSIK